MDKETIENLKSGNYEVVDNQGVSVTTHFIECLEKEFADIETKLAEKDELLQDYRQLVSKLKEELGNVDCEYKTQIFTLKRNLIDECKEHREFCRIADEKVKGLEQQLAEKEKEVSNWKNKKIKYLVDNLLVDRNLAIQTVEEIREDFRQNSFCNDYHEYIVDMEIFEYFHNKIKSLKGEK